MHSLHIGKVHFTINNLFFILITNSRCLLLVSLQYRFIGLQIFLPDHVQCSGYIYKFHG